MSDFDPLRSPFEEDIAPIPVPIDGAPVRSISPLAPRSPLPGQRQFRPQPPPPPPFDEAWSVSPQQQQQQRQQQQPQQQGQGQQVESNSTNWNPQPQPRPPPLVPRSPQAEQGRRIQVDDDEVGRRTRREETSAPVIPLNAFVRIKVVGLEKNRRDVYVKFSAESNLPTFRNSTYRSISRSYAEFAEFAEVIAVNNPQSIVPALPLAQTSAATDEEDDRLVKLAFQTWVARITSDGAIVRDAELRNFIESEFGYTPANRQRRKTPSTFHFPRGARLPDEQDDDLTQAKSAMIRLETAFSETSKVIERIAKSRRAVAAAYADVGDHLTTFSTTESYVPLANGIKKLARTTKIIGDLQAILAFNDQVTLGDAFSYQAMNARSAKDTLINRDVLLDEHRSSVKSSIAKRRTIERLKGSSSIKAERVDDALEELDTATKHETLLAKRLTDISRDLQPSLRTHSRNAHQDIIAALIEHARTNLLYEKQLLKELEVVRPELHAVKSPRDQVYYHQPATPTLSSPNTNMSSPRLSNSMASQTGRPPSPTLSQRTMTSGSGGGRIEENGTRSMYVNSRGGTASLNGNDSRERRSISTLAKSVVLPDHRQRVDAKMAASMLSGF